MQRIGSVRGGATQQATRQGHRRRRRFTAALTTMVLATTALVSVVAEPAGTALAGPGTLIVPTGFTATRVASGLNSPTAMAQAPDGRMFVSQQNGDVRIIENDTLVPTKWGTIPVENGATQGLFGIDFDPDFANNGYVYAFHTLLVNGNLRARVTRFLSSGNTKLPGSTMLWQSDVLRANTAVSHYGGDLHIGADDKLYFSLGDDLYISRPQSLTSQFGKMLRLNLDGSIPTDNPFYTSTTGANRSIYALGLRNPFKFNIDESSGKIFLGDVGRDTYEEINEIVAGGNYGWPTYEGSSGGAAGLIDPVTDYLHTNPGGLEGCSTAGGDFYNPATSQFPSEFAGQFFALDFCNDWIKVIDPDTGAVTDFAEMESPVDGVVADDGSLYLLSRDSNDGGATGGGSVWKVQFTDPGAPQITDQPDSVTVAAGTQVDFDVTATGDAPLSYQWQKNGVDISGATSATYSFVPVLSDDEAVFRVLVANAVGSVFSNTALVSVNGGGGIPAITFDEPAASFFWGGGDTITYAATVTDPEDGTLPPSAYTWTVSFHHNAHFHPFLPATSGAAGGSFVVPLDGETAPDVWFRVQLDAEDSSGNITSAFTDVFPRHSTLTLDTSPSGLAITIDGEVFTGPTEILGVVGLAREISVLSPQDANGSSWDWAGWSNGQTETHTLLFPETDQTVTASFVVGGGGEVAPSVTTEPLDASVLVGDTAEFSVVATGDDPLTYQWQVEDVDIAGATSATYTTPALTLDDDFSGYRVLVTNNVGTVASRTAELRVIDGVPRVTDGLTGLWEFGEGAGSTVADTSGFGTPLDLTIANPANTTWIPVGGISLESATTISSGGAATKIIDASVASGEVTVEAWVTPDSATPAFAGRIAGLTDGSSGTKRNAGISQGWWNSTSDKSTYDGRVRTSGNYNNPTKSPTGAASTDLTHVVMTRSATGSVTLFVDGASVNGRNSTGTLVWHNDVPFVIGNDLSGNYPFIGDVHLAATYSIALNPAQVAQNFESGVAVDATPPTPPAITAQPVSQSVLVGADVAFSVTAEGDAPLSYQWRRNAAPISGETNATLLLGGVQLADSGDVFDAVVTNAAGTVTSTTATLTVNDLPTTDRVVAGLTGLWDFQEGSGSVVTDTSGFEEPLDLIVVNPTNTTWLPAGGLSLDSATAIASSGNATKLIDASVASGEVTIEAWVRPDGSSPATAGRIAALVDGSSGTKRNAGISQGWWNSTTDKSTYDGRVRTTGNYNNPTKSPSGTVSNDLAHVVMTRKASGLVTLYVDGTVVNTRNSTGGIVWHNDVPFVIGNDMSGNYPFRGDVHLVATYQTALSAAEVTQNFEAGINGSTPPSETPPSIVTQPVAVSVSSGQAATFSVSASGDSPLSYQWRRNGSPISGASSASYTLNPAQVADDGATFDVVVTNPFGSATSTAATLSVTEQGGVTVEGTPTVTVVILGGGSLDVTWEVVAAASKYQLRYRPAGSFRRWDAPTTALARTLTGLESGLSHDVEVRSLIGSTWGPWTTVTVVVS